MALEHHRAGRVREAEILYRQVLQTHPDHPGALHLLGLIAHQVGRHADAVELIGKAITRKPAVAEFHNDIGEAFRALGRYEDAKASYHRALALRADLPYPAYNLGLLHHRQGNLEEAVACYRRALQGDSSNAETHNNLGNVLKELGKVEEAVAHYRKALALKPDFAEAHNNLGTVFQEQRQVEEAVACFQRALALKPDYSEAENQLMHQLQHLCDWSRHHELGGCVRRRIQEAPSSIVAPFTLLSIQSSPAEHLACARNWVTNRLSGAVAHRERLGFRFERVPKPRLRLGYLSADLREHAIGYLIAELFELHDRNYFEVLAYSYGPDDGGKTRTRIAQACDRFVDITGVSSEKAARVIYEDGVDLLIDLQGYTGPARSQIVAMRPAPLQINYLGYPGTMGAEFMDYVITDRFITPPELEPFFTEKFVYLPDCYQINDRKRAIAEQTPTRTGCGLPEEGIVFCCFNTAYKITPEIFDVWMRLLDRVPGSVVWLLESNSAVPVNLRREAKVRGINPDRLVFAPKIPVEQHLARFRVASLFLDTVPYNAHTTTSEALWTGLPVLTCAGETFASRVAGSLLRAVGLPELVTSSLPEYEATALRLAQDPSELARLRERLANNRMTAPLFDSARYTRHLEQAYHLMWDIYANGEAPRRIEVLRKS